MAKSTYMELVFYKRIVKMTSVLFFVFCLVTSIINHRAYGIQSQLKEDLELERQLKLLNKPPVKSIQTKYGHIVDCIDINKQPAFDHPLLKNHKLQREPSFQKSIEKTTMENSPAKPIFGLEKGTCPPGTVPIRRTTKDDIIRVKSLLNNHILDQDNLDSHVAQVTMLKDGGPYYGVSGATSIYNPRCGNDQTSAAHIWAQNGQDDGTNKITVGWHVSPKLYGNDKTYLYSVWTSDNFKKTGCYNVLCPGFVQTDTEYYIGSPVAKTSVYGGEMVQLSVSLLQDENTKNWFVYMVNRTVGYFPAALFSNMAIADQVGWGGRTTTPTGTPNPTMGSGYFPDDNFVHACYFVNVAYQNASRKYYGPETYWAESFTDVPKCYGVEYYGDQGRQVGYSLQFGGPGGDCTN